MIGSEKRRVQAGDKLYVRFLNYGAPVTVLKLGRKYLYLKEHDLRFDLKDWSPHFDNLRFAKLYESAEAYETEVATAQNHSLLLSALRRFFEWGGAGTKAPVATLEAAAKALGIEVNYDKD